MSLETNNSKEINNDNNKVPWTIWDAIYIGFFVFFLSILVASIAHHFSIDPSNPLLVTSVQVFLPIMAIISVLFYVRFIYKAPVLDSLGLRITGANFKKYLFSGILLSFLILFSAMLISFITIVFTNRPMENPYENFSTEQLKIISILSILIAPIFEELYFRGFMQPAACKVIGNIPGTIFVAIVFALIHQQYLQYPAALMIIVCLALILGFARLYYNSTIPCIIGHMLNNVYATIWIFNMNYV